MLTPGRFDKKVYLGIANDTDSRINVLKAQTRKIMLSDDVDFDYLEKKIPKNLTGADFSSFVSQSYLKAIDRLKLELVELVKEKEGGIVNRRSVRKVLSEIKEIDIERYAGLTSVRIGLRDFEECVEKIKPSVSESDMKNYENLEAKFSK